MHFQEEYPVWLKKRTGKTYEYDGKIEYEFFKFPFSISIVKQTESVEFIDNQLQERNIIIATSRNLENYPLSRLDEIEFENGKSFIILQIEKNRNVPLWTFTLSTTLTAFNNE